jgi:hypothetical protein
LVVEEHISDSGCAQGKSHREQAIEHPCDDKLTEGLGVRAAQG